MQLGQGAAQATETDQVSDPAAESLFCSLSLPGQPYSIHLYLSALDQLELGNSTGVAGGGRERRCAGIMAGRQSFGADRIVAIQSFVPVSKDEAEEGSAQTHGVLRLLQTWSDGQSRGLYAVGYYRLCPRERQELLPEDAALLRQLSAPALVMLIDPVTRDARLFLRSRGTEELAKIEFPFDRRILASAEGFPKTPRNDVDSGVGLQSRLPEAVSVGPAPASASDSLHRRPGASNSKTRNSRQWLVWVGAPLLLASGFAAVRFVGSGQPKRDVAPAKLGLHLERAGSDLRMTWNRDASVMQRARGGVLSIWDGSARRDVELGANEIRHGMVVYSPAPAHDVRVQLHVLADSGPESESVLFVSDRAPLASTESPATRGLPANAELPKATLVPAIAAAGQPGASGGSRRPAMVTREFQPPPQRPRALPVPELPTGSGSASLLPAGPVAAVLSAPAASSGPPESVPLANARLNVEAAPAPQPESAVANMTTPSRAADPESVKPGDQHGSMPAPAFVSQDAPGQEAANRPPGYTPPRAIRRLMPVLSPRLKGMMRREPVEVRVLVRISPSGRVLGVTPIPGQNGVTALLTPTAVDAVRGWVFEPATLHGKKITSEQQVTFRFEPRQ